MEFDFVTREQRMKKAPWIAKEILIDGLALVAVLALVLACMILIK